MEDSGRRSGCVSGSKSWRRLPPEAYRGNVAAMFTVCVAGRAAAFEDRESFECLRDILAGVATEHDCVVPVYTFMPDHLHVLTLGRSERSDSLAMMQSFKVKAGHWLKGRRPGVKLQRRFFDRVIWMFEDWRNEAWYIANNPVRAGFVDDPFAWPQTGAIGQELGEIKG